MLLVAISGKLFGGYVGLVIATMAYQAGLIDLALFSIVVAIGVITTILSPITARIAISRQLKNLERREEAPQASERAVAPPVA